MPCAPSRLQRSSKGMEAIWQLQSLKRSRKARGEASEVREIGKEIGDVLPRIRRVTESVVAAALLARRGGCGHWVSMENLVAGHCAVDRGKGVGIVAVAGFAESIIACAWRVVFSDAEGGGDVVKDCEVSFASGGVGNVKEGRGDGWVVVRTTLQGVASGVGVGKERRRS